MADEQVVQMDVSEEATPVVETPKPTADEATLEKLVAKKLDELTPRIFQSLRDKAKFEANEAVLRAQREAQGYKLEADELAQQLGAVDPQQAELARLRSRDRRYRETETQDAQKRQLTEFDEQFKGSISDALKAMDIDPSDTRIDWADGTSNYIDRQKKILASAAKISKENQTKAQEIFAKKLADEITVKVRKELGVDSVDTSAPSGAGGSNKLTPEKVAKMTPDERFARRAEIDEMDFGI